jgi:hypothetical protein
MRVLLAILLLATFSACATTSEACVRVEQCLKRCENAGTSRENRETGAVPGYTGSTCDRECGSCNAQLASPPPSKPAGTPTYTGNTSH